MARLLTAGFESGHDVSEGLVTAAGTSDVISGGRTGLQRRFTGVAGANWARTGVSLDTNGEWFARFYLMIVTAPAGAQLIAGFGSTAAPSDVHILLNANRTIQLRRGVSTNVGSASAALTLNQWYRIELRYKVGVGAVDEVEARIDGVQLAIVTAVSITDTNPAAFAVGWQGTPGGTTPDIRFDDVAVNDASGSDQNSWPGDGNIVLLKPISDSFRPSLWNTGAGGITNLWDGVDNTPPAGLVSASATHTSQIEHGGGSAGTTDGYEANMTSYASAGVPAGATINLVQPVAVTGEDIATGAKLLSFNVKSNPATTNTGAFDVNNGVSAAVGTFPTNWFTKADAPVAYAPTVVLGTSPVMTIIRPETASRVASCCFMGIIVDYTPAVVASDKLPGPILKAIAPFPYRYIG